MSKSKPKRTKHYNPRKCPVRRIITPNEIAEVKAAFLSVDFAVEYKLPRGTCDMTDVQSMREYLNLATGLTCVGYGIDHALVQERYGQEWRQMQDAFHTYYGRVLETGKFVATGDELKAIRNGFEVASVVVNAALDADPHNVYRTFVAVKRMADTPTPRIEFSETQINSEIRKVAHAES